MAIAIIADHVRGFIRRPDSEAAYAMQDFRSTAPQRRLCGSRFQDGQHLALHRSAVSPGAGAKSLKHRPGNIADGQTYRTGQGSGTHATIIVAFLHQHNGSPGAGTMAPVSCGERICCQRLF